MAMSRMSCQRNSVIISLMKFMTPYCIHHHCNLFHFPDIMYSDYICPLQDGNRHDCCCPFQTPFKSLVQDGAYERLSGRTDQQAAAQVFKYLEVFYQQQIMGKGFPEANSGIYYNLILADAIVSCKFNPVPDKVEYISDYIIICRVCLHVHRAAKHMH